MRHPLILALLLAACAGETPDTPVDEPPEVPADPLAAPTDVAAPPADATTTESGMEVNSARSKTSCAAACTRPGRSRLRSKMVSSG